MNLPAPALAEYQQAMHRAKTIRPCEDCMVARESGNAYCAICSGRCCNCYSEDVTHRGRTLSDGRVEWWCNACDSDWMVDERVAHPRPSRGEIAYGFLAILQFVRRCREKAEDQRRRDLELTGEPTLEKEQF